MMKIKYIATQLLLCSVLFSSCDKYLEIEPRGRQLLKTTDDFDLWLNGDKFLSESVDNVMNYMTDNVDIPNIGNPPTGLAQLVYTWAPQFTTDVNSPTKLWGDHYERINLFNTVLIGIDKAQGGTDSKKKSLKAEALLGRAHSYFYLVNEYGKPYDPSTAATDLAVPYVTTDDVGSTAPARSTIAEIYQYIIDDINMAIPDLPIDNSNARFRGSKAAAYSVLARVYLYRRAYSEAQRYAELALQDSKARMIDYTNPASFPTTSNVVSHPDVIYGRAVNSAGIPISQELKAMFDVTDARRTVLYTNFAASGRGVSLFYASIYAAFQWTNSGTTVQEMRLIAAEGAARANNLTAALTHLNEVRRNRYTGTNREYSAQSAEEILTEVLDERRRELPFHGLRWFDMRRLDSENRMPEVQRLNAQDSVIAVLEPKSTKYTLEVPIQVLAFNPDMK